MAETDVPLTPGTRVREVRHPHDAYDRGPWGGVLLKIDGDMARVRWDSGPEEHWPGCMPPEAWPAKQLAREVVHVIFGGQALCGFMAGVMPSSWLPGHVWTGVETPELASCPGCVERLSSAGQEAATVGALRARLAVESVVAFQPTPAPDPELLLRQRDYWRELARRIAAAYTAHVGCESDVVAMEAFNPKEPT